MGVKMTLKWGKKWAGKLRVWRAAGLDFMRNSGLSQTKGKIRGGFIGEKIRESGQTTLAKIFEIG
jgi:hypothetical protein